MTDYAYESILAADPFTFQRAANADMAIYDANDENNALLLTLKDLNGLVLPNPLTSSADGFMPAFVTTSPQIKMIGGGLGVIASSFQAVRDDALAARNAAETAQLAATAAAELVSAPADSAVSTLVSAASTTTRLALDTLYLPKLGTRGVTRTIYVRATGNDSNNGSSIGSAYREIKAAVDSLAAYGPYLIGTVKIDVGPGTYKGGIRKPLTRGDAQDDFLFIQGPTVTHPTSPTAVIDYAADQSVTSAIQTDDGDALWLENIKTVGAFPIHIDIRRNSYVWFKNVHSDGQKVGSVGGKVGWAINTQARYYVAGGLIQNMVDNGIQELFGVVRSYNNVTSNAAQLTIRNCDVGFQAKEACVGHLDYLNVEDCNTGLEFNAGCVTNLKSVSLKRNGLGVANVNSEVHNETGVVWGAGADANIREWKTVVSPELYASGWVDSATPRTSNVAHAPLIVLAANHGATTLVGPTTETNFHSFPTLLKAHRYNTAGKKFKLAIRGQVNNTLAGSFRILLRAGGNFLTDVTIPAGTVNSSRFEAEYEVICTADGNNQICLSKLTGEGVVNDYTDPARSFDLASSDRSVAVSGLSTSATDSVTLKLCEVLG